MFEVIIVLLVLAVSLGLLALLVWIIYAIIKAAVKNGILEAHKLIKEEEVKIIKQNEEEDL